MNNNHDIGESFNKLLRSIFYEYGGVRAEMRNDGTVVYKGQPMGLVDFHRLVDEMYDNLSESINRLKNK